MSESTYKKIEEVLAAAKKPLAEFEFVDVDVPVKEWPHHDINGRNYVGITESTLGRRLRELRGLGRVTSKRREGKLFMEYTMAVKAPVQAEFPAEAVAA